LSCTEIFSVQRKLESELVVARHCPAWTYGNREKASLSIRGDTRLIPSGFNRWVFKDFTFLLMYEILRFGSQGFGSAFVLCGSG
jgi:hypothetical protein